MFYKNLTSLFFIMAASTMAVVAQSFNKAKMDSLLNAVSAGNRCMGSLAINRNGQTIYARAIGYADVEKKVPATIKTRYRIGSISKMFTGVMIFQLIEEGKLTLATPLSNFFPQLPNASKINIGLMLQHRSGLHNFTNDPAFEGYLNRSKTQQEMLALFVTQASDFEPDGRTEYSNTNFVLLGYIVEKLTKKPYAQAVKERVITKAGLTDTYYGGKIVTANNEAHSYKYERDGWLPDTETDMSIPAGAGAMVSTPTDLNNFIEALFAGKLVSKAHLASMQTIKDGLGMAMIATPIAGHMGYGHNGRIDGFGSQVIYFPGDKMSVTIIRNADADVMADVLLGAINIYFNKPYIIPNFQLKMKEADLAKYTGLYSSKTFPLKITVTLGPGDLVAQATGQGTIPLKLIAPNVFGMAAAGIIMEFDPAKDQMTLKQNGMVHVFTKEAVKAVQVSQADLDNFAGVYGIAGAAIKITVSRDGATLKAQATGQSAFPLEATANSVFQFTLAGIVIEFDMVKKQMTLKQGGQSTIFTKEK